MYKKKKILAIVPARAGSKGIKNKNLMKINGFYLIEYLSRIIKKTGIIDLSILSSDSNKIIKIAEQNEIISLFKRPKNISGDKIGDHVVLKHALIRAEEIKKTKFDIILMIQLTSPLRKSEYLISAIKKIVDKKFDSIWSVSRVDKKFHPLKQLNIIGDKLKYHTPEGFKIIRRQQLKDTFYRNGAIYAFTRKTIMGKTLLPKNSSFILINEKQMSIDTHEDIKEIKNLIKFEK